MHTEPTESARKAAQDVSNATKPVLGLLHKAAESPGSFAQIFRDHGYMLELACLPAGERPARPFEEYAALVVFGGAQQVDQEDIHPWLSDEKQLIREAISTEMPYLGVCLGAQLLADVVGGEVGPAALRRRGIGDVGLTPEAESDPIFGVLPKTFRTVVWHSYEFKLPPDAIPLGRSTTALQAFRLRGKAAWAVQFHPEVTPAEMKNWVTWMREGELDVREEELERYEAELSLIMDAQMELAHAICGGFIAMGIEGSVAPSSVEGAVISRTADGVRHGNPSDFGLEDFREHAR